MLGAIIGDIAGSRFEFANHRRKDFTLFAADCFFTDDSVLTLAVAKAIMETAGVAAYDRRPRADNRFYLGMLQQMTTTYLRQFARDFPGRGYGGRFLQWTESNDSAPYNSYGNGAAMRVSPVSQIAEDEAEVLALAEAVTAPTHNHPEGLRGAKAVALAIFLAQQNATKAEIKRRITADYYPLDFSLADIRDHYVFNETCQQTVPQALTCFFEADSFEDTLRTAVALGGDSDTIAAIAGSVAEAFYHIPAAFSRQAMTYLDPALLQVVQAWHEFVPAQRTDNTKRA